ncbi:hypothetical protein [Streptomyces albireticuli]|uniref:Uncharacterized protein n=1 Tax=Streptomyces albireticuli TaxID=1940 RepID=A0A2A2DD11_9ACTN|nr:hypothetical protein [Streptomyces albireticuli]MCD9144975.1 hypothetical protein [Streptomyces albireticuli]MCD9164401.1 hypothetical protein [Streptomyces albireticuli]MCD9194112.1 hypothetical protein [Streptomyces albireticuli]PAU49404.1 hypothetical protein CK936_08090 [Streptomyces albireticuli]
MIQKSPAALVDELLAVIDPMPRPRRLRHTALRARELRDSGELGPVVAELARRGAYGRGLAALAARAGHDSAWLQARLTDPESAVRHHAVTAVRRGDVPDAAVTAAMEDAPAAVRRELTRAVVAGRRTALADTLVRSVRARWGDDEAARLLPACGPGTVAELLPGLFHRVTGWTGLARHHSAAILDEAGRQLAAIPETSRRDWWAANAASVAATVETEPQRVLDLLERYCHDELPDRVQHRISRLAAAAPGRTVRLLLAPERGTAHPLRLGTPVLRTLVRHDPPELTDLARALGHDQRALAHLLRRMAPSRRAACYDAAMTGRATGHSVLSDELLEALPRARREAEARRMAAQAREHGATWQRVLGCVAFLPVAEARPELLAATRRPLPEDRAYAYQLLLRNAARTREPAAVTALLADDLDRLRNEQDPVRSPALTALAGIHPALFTREAVPHLERVATDALEARDLSWNGVSALGDLAHSLLREHAGTAGKELTDWALRTLTRLLPHSRPRLEGLRHGQERAILDALLPSVEAAAARADHAPLLHLARGLGRRAHAFPEIQDLLRRAVREGTDGTAIQAVWLWLDDPRTSDERLCELLALDASFATHPLVARVLANRRTDLLDIVLGDTPPYGRLLPANRHWLPLVGPCAASWTPRQQAAAARLLARAAQDTSLTTHQRAAAIRGAAWIPGHGTEILRHHADGAEVPLAEAALAALAHTDRPGEHLTALLAHAGGDRARVAIYAATRVSRFVAPSHLAVALRGLLLADGGVKVTSRKEAARLAAAVLPVREAAALLAEACAHPGQHRDVQAACVAVTTDLLDLPEAWEMLEAAVTGRRELRSAVLGTSPYQLREEHRTRYAGLVHAMCRTDDPEVAEAGYAALEEWSRWVPEAAGTLVDVVTDLDDRTGWRTAATTLCRVVTTGPSGTPDPAPLLRALGILIAADAGGGTPDAEPDRDRPAPRRVRHVVARLIAGGRWNRRLTSPVTHAVVELLRTSPDFVADAVELTAQNLDLDATPDALAAELTRLAGLHDGRPALAARTAEGLDQRLRTSRNGDDHAFGQAARTLSQDGGHAAGLLAVTLTATGGRRTDWADHWRESLRELRRHPHPDVRDAALALTTAAE